MTDKFCEKHRRWPCWKCGTSHYNGCQCSFCNNYTPEQKAKLRWRKVQMATVSEDHK